MKFLRAGILSRRTQNTQILMHKLQYLLNKKGRIYILPFLFILSIPSLLKEKQTDSRKNYRSFFNFNIIYYLFLPFFLTLLGRMISFASLGSTVLLAA